MFHDVFRFIRGVWEAVVRPYMIVSIANLATDGWEAVTHLRDTLVVLFCFLWGCSHRSFPLSRSALEAQRAALAPSTTSTSGATAKRGSRGGLLSDVSASSPSHAASVAQRHAYHGASEDEANDADSEAEFPSSRRVPLECTRASPDTPACRTSSGSDDTGLAPTLIQRRLLLGKKGEVEEWMAAQRGRPLIPPHHALSLSRSLHQLVSIVIGPIQQPTVATMPTRHPEPQWPPHFLRTGSSGTTANAVTGNTNSAGNNNNTGSNSAVGGGNAGSSVGDPSTDDYSSSNSSATPHHSMRLRSGGGGSSGSGGGGASASRYRLASSVVYQRVSSRHLDFSNSRVAPHLIASITAHHVLSYPATRQKVLVMDLDETLCYVSTSTANMAGPPTFSEVIPTASGAELFHVWERPYARLFLATAAKLFNLVLFTSASKPYADTILQRIDPGRLLRLRYYRQDCRLVPRGLLKKMCDVAGMKGVSTGKLTRQSSGDRTGANNTSPLGDFRVPAHRSSDGGLGSNAVHNADDDTAGCESGGGASGSASEGGTGRDEREPMSIGMNEQSRGVDKSSAPAATVNSTFSCSFSRGLSTPIAAGGPGSARSPPPPPPASSQHHHQHSNNSSSNSSIHHGTGIADDLPALEKTALNEHAKVLVKDLRVLKVPPELLVMIDNSEECTLVNPENALIVSPYIPSLTKGSSSEKTVPATASSHATRGDGEHRDGRNDHVKTQGAGELGQRNSKDMNASADGGGNGGDGADAAAASSSSSAAAATSDDRLLLNDDINANEGAEEEDEVLLALLPMLECLLVVPDVRSVLRLGKLY